MSRRETSPEVAVQLPESKFVATEMSEPGCCDCRKADVIQVAIRLICVVTSVTGLWLMATAKDAATVSVYGFQLPVHSKWSASDSFEYLLGVSAAVAAYSVLQVLIGGTRLLRNPGLLLYSRSHAWLVFAGDQVFAYAMISAGSAAAGVANLNRTGIQHTALPNFCKPLSNFCDRAAVSIAFTFLSFILLATSAVLNVASLAKSKY